MRPKAECLAVAALALSAASCSPRHVDANIDTIEVHRSGDWAYNVVIHADGRGEFEGSSLLPERGKKTFKLRPEDFRSLASALHPYQLHAVAVTDKSLNDILTRRFPGCKPEQSYAQDAPALYLRWQGPRTNVHYFVDFGCDEKRNGERNKKLMDAVHRLPIQQFVGDFR